MPVELSIHDLAQTDAPPPGQVARHLGITHLGVELFGRTAAHQFVPRHGGAHLFEELLQKKGLELAADACQGRRTARRAGARGDGRVLWYAFHQMISSLACNAPAALMAWKMATRSRGETPSMFKARTTSPMFTPGSSR